MLNFSYGPHMNSHSSVNLVFPAISLSVHSRTSNCVLVVVLFAETVSYIKYIIKFFCANFKQSPSNSLHIILSYLFNALISQAKLYNGNESILLALNTVIKSPSVENDVLELFPNKNIQENCVYQRTPVKITIPIVTINPNMVGNYFFSLNRSVSSGLAAN